MKNRTDRNFSSWALGLGLLATLSLAMAPLQGAFVALDVLPKEIAITLDGHQQFEAVTVDETGEAVDVTHQVVWTTSDGTNATVADGLATPLTRGGCWIFADLGDLRGRAQLIVTSPLKPEDEIIEYHRSVPDPASKDYLSVNEVIHPDVVSFNNAPKTVRSVTISGKTVIIEQGSPLNALYESYNGAADILDLAIYAETVIIRDHLSLPQTIVTIFARELRFEDRGNGRPPAALETTPLSLDTRPTEIGANGGPGLKAGDITLRIEDFHSDPGTNTRFNLRGGTGQPSGPGQDGTDGKSVQKSCGNVHYHCIPGLCENSVTCFVDTTEFPGDEDIWYYEVFGGLPPCPCSAADAGPCAEVLFALDTSTNYRCGVKAWPEDGKDALPPGYPGAGGNAGDLLASLDLAAYAELGGGSPGAPAQGTSGGQTGTPINSVWIEFYIDPFIAFGVTWAEWHTSHKGADGPALNGEIGKPGTFSLIGMPTFWLHPSTLKTVLQHAKDAYLNGNLDYVEGRSSPTTRT